MIKAVIIEDEKLAVDNLLYYLKLTKEEIEIQAVLDSVQDAVHWFNHNPHPDLIFMDINLKDGNSFIIFEKVSINTPVIFITAFDSYTIKAFEKNGIDYLLKPFSEVELMKAILKYKNLKKHFLNNYDQLLNFFKEKEQPKKTRMVVKKGVEFQTVLFDDIAYFFTEQKVCFLVTKEGKKFLVDKTLKELEEELDKKKFYRVNRKFIINIDYTKSYKAFDKIKILVELSISTSEAIIVSQESTGEFRQWIHNL